ncbi:MAG: P1 family peptidase [Bacillota bacterium]
MNKYKRIRDYGFQIGELSTGKSNKITDVKGVKVGHCTLDSGQINTGVTAILPHSGNVFKKKVIAASHVINGFGKSTGLVQINELGTIETPIILTNTLNVGIAHQALVEYMLNKNKDIAEKTGTVNPVILECNDQYLNDIRGLHIKEKDIFKALANVDKNFLEGSVGAGKGMSCYGLKGGVGSASRKLTFGDKNYHIGTIVLSNFGKKKDFLLDGIKAGKIIKRKEEEIGRESSDLNKKEKGSIIIVLATDIPLSNRQLKRISKRALIGLNRTGSYMGNGSGEIVIAFSTVNKIDHYEKSDIVNMKVFNENKIDKIFRAAAESTEEAIYNSLICADKTKGRNERIRYSLKDYIDYIVEKRN